MVLMLLLLMQVDVIEDMGGRVKANITVLNSGNATLDSMLTSYLVDPSGEKVSEHKQEVVIEPSCFGMEFNETSYQCEASWGVEYPIHYFFNSTMVRGDMNGTWRYHAELAGTDVYDTFEVVKPRYKGQIELFFIILCMILLFRGSPDRNI